MENLNKTTVAVPNTSDDDPRIGHFLEKKLAKNDLPEAVIIGFPSDKGVTINGGRAGAADAPQTIREQLYKMTPNPENHNAFLDLIRATKDVGDLNIRYEVEEDQHELGEVVAKCLEQGVVPIILGGGHETAFGHFLGYAKAGLKTAIFNLDAHTDVRPLKDGQAHSGSPFRQAMEHESSCAEMYLAAGLQPHSVSRSHLQYIKESGGAYLLRDETNITSISGLFHQHESDRLMVTFDMDAVDQSQAPGVSAPCANGLPSDLWLTAAYLAGRNKEVTSFDLSEVNPRHDRDNQTAKLAALTIWNFLLGLSERE
ncbi:arginase [Aliifodinibius salipaludis]|uniref:Arginase n=1 Tax=Fodinibius salipaludis TaxID=2032627 RepID=A0A2A2GEK1_9BACT|nr:formimidoylglutamase [Aliifodinibius salipaludis]PAU95313.1 arginase [Aliifodinibius salipaludis]